MTPYNPPTSMASVPLSTDRRRPGLWRRLHGARRRVRWPVKIGLFLLVLLVVLYPRLWLLPEHLRRSQNTNSVLDPAHPTIAYLALFVQNRLPPAPTPEEVRVAVQEVVYTTIPYDYDWNVWGVADYLPTVDEVFKQGREDCDGRAVIAASLLRHLGHDAWLATDLGHMWVVSHAPGESPDTPAELMSPGPGDKTIVSDASGTHARLTFAALENGGRGLGLGIALFPLFRVVMIVAALYLLTLHPHSPWWRRIGGAVLLTAAVVLLRTWGSVTYYHPAGAVYVWLGLMLGVAGWVLVALKSPVPRAAIPVASSASLLAAKETP